MKKLPSDPDFLPKQEIAKMDWAISFSAALALLGGKYNILQALIDAVVANTVVISTFKANFVMSRSFVSALLANKAGLFTVNPPDPELEVDLAKFPALVPWPKDTVVRVGIMRSHLQAAELLLANSKLSTADRTALGLDKQPNVPSNRKTAEDFNYPFLAATVENGVAKLRIKRGNRFKNMVCQVVMATGEGGKFNLLTLSTGQSVEVPVTVPEGKLAATLVFQAAYMNGNVLASDWSPLLVVAVGKANEPEVAKAA